ncbi:IS66 family insertion sequence element accessory protein TnpB [Bradyrhizobium sp. 33ap4]|uniref:IS66 family insertion sequence element accessory protein TnpB n=1 Tax=Bradyrhizobium sp. 33ap4 TaxID=3061630 RepID=UPI00292F7FBA|nr:IS66 family insertion sequence element accessory protein TnpB [Bradyrhizobium sp. 33ap4]
MLTPPASLMIYVATQPVDFRKGAEGLALLAKETQGYDPMKGGAVVSVRSAPIGRRLSSGMAAAL